MTHRLAGTVEKFNRSKEQFDELLREMDAFFNAEPKPYGTAGELDMNAREWIERFQVHETPPLRLGVILGDCVHNLRSALDHLVWQLTLLDGGTPDDETQFPIASKSEAQFDRMAERRVPHLTDAHRATIKRAQPYHGGNEADSHPLAVLATLSNTDKHKLVHPTYSFMATDADEIGRHFLGMAEEGMPIARVKVIANNSRLKDGTPWLQLGFDGEELPTEVKVSGELALGIAFGEIGVPADDFLKLAETVRLLINIFLADFPETEIVEA